jgi:hypothetical protein
MDKNELCEQIRKIYPDIGACAIDVDVNFDENKNAWIVTLNKDNKTLTTHLETEEADACMLGQQCVSLGIQVGELVKNLRERPATRQSEGV